MLNPYQDRWVITSVPEGRMLEVDRPGLDEFMRLNGLQGSVEEDEVRYMPAHEEFRGGARGGPEWRIRRVEPHVGSVTATKRSPIGAPDIAETMMRAYLKKKGPTKMGFGVYSTHADPELPGEFECVGAAKTLRGAETIAKRALKGPVYGYMLRHDDNPRSYGSYRETSHGERVVRIREGYYKV